MLENQGDVFREKFNREKVFKFSKNLKLTMLDFYVWYDNFNNHSHKGYFGNNFLTTFSYKMLHSHKDFFL